MSVNYLAYFGFIILYMAEIYVSEFIEKTVLIFSCIFL